MGLAYGQQKHFSRAAECMSDAYEDDPKFLYVLTKYMGVWGHRFIFLVIPLYILSVISIVWMTSWWIVLPIAYWILFRGSLILLSFLHREYSNVQRQLLFAAWVVIVATVTRQFTGRSVPW